MSTTGCSPTTSNSSAMQKPIRFSKLAKAWTNRVLAVGGEEQASSASSSCSHDAERIRAALARTMPLLLGINDKEASSSSFSSDSSFKNAAAAVPFVCRYRSDIIQPLTTPMVHELADCLQIHQSLEGLRNRVLEHINKNPELQWRVETSLSKCELDDLYAPYKPPSQGSLEDRIQKDHPELISVIDAFWESSSSSSSSGSHNTATSSVDKNRGKYYDQMVTLLASRIANSSLETMDAMQSYTHRWCTIKVRSGGSSKGTTTTSSKKSSGRNHNNNNKESTYQTYVGYENRVHRLHDYQVLAIRRGVQRKALKFTLEMDQDRAKAQIRSTLRDRIQRTIATTATNHNNAQQQHATKKNNKPRSSPLIANLWKDAIHDAWSRLLRRRCTTRVWKAACDAADDRGIRVFCHNLRNALLAPPPSSSAPTVAVLGVDPGFKSGIKTAMIDAHGALLMHFANDTTALNTVSFTSDYDIGKEQMAALLTTIQTYQDSNGGSSDDPVVVALGNGHGTQEARKLLGEASEMTGIAVDIHLVNEAGASVWSVTEGARREFPKDPPAAIAAVSIARRYQNPLAELVKIPPQSLGLGMYQHDFPEKQLGEKLHLTSVDAVAEVGVDVNACSLEILGKVPGLTRTLSERIIQARPLKSRNDLLQVSGIGSKTYENCAAFVRVRNGLEGLDQTLCHPESYPLARHVLKKMNLSLTSDPLILNGIPRSAAERKSQWKELISEAAHEFGVSQDRVLSVIDQLMSAIAKQDPRLCTDSGNGGHDVIHTERQLTTTKDTLSLSPELSSDMNELKKACPVRNVLGHVRNVVDFGAFVDIGVENNGLLHRSQLEGRSLNSLMVGQEIGVDILSVSSSSSKDKCRISLSLSCLTNSKPATASGDSHSSKKRKSDERKPSANKRRQTVNSSLS